MGKSGGVYTKKQISPQAEAACAVESCFKDAKVGSNA
jgi:hypothetical protein